MASVKTSNQVLSVINTFFEVFQKWCNQPNNPTPADLDKFLSPHFELISNGEVMVSGLSNYLERIKKIRSKCAHVDLIGPLEPVVFEDRVVLQYELDMRTHDGQPQQVFVMAVATVVDNKISQWIQVTHAKVNKDDILGK